MNLGSLDLDIADLERPSLSEAGGRRQGHPADYLLAYWMNHYLGFISAVL